MELAQSFEDFDSYADGLLLWKGPLVTVDFSEYFEVHLAHFHDQVDALVLHPLVADVLYNILVVELSQQLDFRGDVLQDLFVLAIRKNFDGALGFGLHL